MQHPTPVAFAVDREAEGDEDELRIDANGRHAEFDVSTNEVGDFPRQRRRNLILTALLFIPSRIAIPVITLVAGRGIAKSAGANDRHALAGGLGLLLASRAAQSTARRRQHADALMARNVQRGVAWAEALQAVAAIVQRFVSGV